VLGTHAHELARLQPVESFEEFVHEWLEVRNPIGARAQEHDAERPVSECLLLLDVPIHRNEGIEAPACTLQQFTILETLPAQPAYRLNVVTWQQCGKVDGNVLVK
jgi:hypothetical protein